MRVLVLSDTSGEMQAPSCDMIAGIDVPIRSYGEMQAISMNVTLVATSRAMVVKRFSSNGYWFPSMYFLFN